MLRRRGAHAIRGMVRHRQRVRRRRIVDALPVVPGSVHGTRYCHLTRSALAHAVQRADDLLQGHRVLEQLLQLHADEHCVRILARVDLTLRCAENLSNVTVMTLLGGRITSLQLG